MELAISDPAFRAMADSPLLSYKSLDIHITFILHPLHSAHLAAFPALCDKTEHWSDGIRVLDNPDIPTTY